MKVTPQRSAALGSSFAADEAVNWAVAAAAAVDQTSVILLSGKTYRQHQQRKALQPYLLCPTLCYLPPSSLSSLPWHFSCRIFLICIEVSVLLLSSLVCPLVAAEKKWSCNSDNNQKTLPFGKPVAWHFVAVVAIVALLVVVVIVVCVVRFTEIFSFFSTLHHFKCGKEVIYDLKLLST